MSTAIAAIKPTVTLAHRALLARLSALKPHVIRGCADAVDFGDRSAHLTGVLAAVADYVEHVLDDTHDAAPWGLPVVTRQAMLDALRGIHDASNDTYALLRCAADEAREYV